jgi:hypothetical protein
MTTKQATTKDMNRNPKGKGGFGDNPENRNPGGWRKEDSIGYQYNMLQRLTVDEFKKWLVDNPDNKRTMAQELAYNAVLKARKELNYLKEVTDRTEGKAPQSIDVTSGGDKITKIEVEFIAPNVDSTNKDTPAV